MRRSPVQVLHNWHVLFGLLCAALLAICLVFGLIVIDARRDVTRGVAVSAGNLASAVSHDVDRNLELLDLALKSVTESWIDPKVHALDPALRDMILFDRSALAQELESLIVLDANGAVTAASKAGVAQGMSFADRDYFRVHLANSEIGLFVSKPFINGADGTWQLGLSRRINDPAGGFGGVVVGTLQLSYLSKLYQALNIGSDGSITLFRTDGRIIVREPYVGSDVRRSLGPSDGFDRMRSSRSGSFEGPSPIDGERRIVSFHRVGSLPLIQDVEVSVGEAYAAWWRKTVATGGVLGLLCLCTLTLAAMLHAELKRRTAIEARLEHMAATDPLTELANRRRFGEALEAEWRRALRERTTLSLLIIDADWFKAYNDTYGHPAGDALIRALARCIDSKLLRPGDVAARYGGEEFAALMPTTDLSGALAVAEAIRTAVVDLAQPHAGSPERIATVSIGAASIRPAPGQSVDELMAAADAALYRAKQEGRNRCHVMAPAAELAAA